MATAAGSAGAKKLGQPVALVLNAPAVLDHNAVNRVLNIGAETSLNYHTPSSVYLQQVLRPFVSDLIPAEDTFGNDNPIWPHRDDQNWPHPMVVISSLWQLPSSPG